MYQCSTITVSELYYRNTTSLLCKMLLFLESQNIWSTDWHAEPKPCSHTPRCCADITGGMWEVSEDLDSSPYPLRALVLRFTNSPVLFPEESVVCSWFKGGKLLQPVANLAKEFMNLESLNSCKILEITDGKGLRRIIWIHVPKQDCFVQLILQSFVQTDFEKLFYDIYSQC